MGDVPLKEGDGVSGVKKNSVREILKRLLPLCTHQNIHKGKSGYPEGTSSGFEPLMGPIVTDG